jgi:death-on-curing protein
MGYIYVDVNYAIRTHDKILEISGGWPGILDGGRLESILEHIQNDDYYPTFIEKITHLVYAINKGHCFNDGNKRTSIALGAFFLEINGLDVLVSKFVIEMENISVAIADNLIDKALFNDIIYSLLNEEEYNEALKLRIINRLDIDNANSGEKRI